jgi:hypothetical protein
VTAAIILKKGCCPSTKASEQARVSASSQPSHLQLCSDSDANLVQPARLLFFSPTRYLAGRRPFPSQRTSQLLRTRRSRSTNYDRSTGSLPRHAIRVLGARHNVVINVGCFWLNSSQFRCSGQLRYAAHSSADILMPRSRRRTQTTLDCLEDTGAQRTTNGNTSRRSKSSSCFSGILCGLLQEGASCQARARLRVVPSMAFG